MSVELILEGRFIDTPINVSNKQNSNNKDKEKSDSNNENEKE